ncbi:MAG: Gfo/Idh/MocA family oxidoreductase [Microbacteriaceae bacterium]|nr:Gfo/Idh/MocA family oxidoreductase [Microbacteriaceae bacterium]MCL2796249.1 Gfo/Idh/MocA family oxidoreductase [Microbacteriaceae bacterium]
MTKLRVAVLSFAHGHALSYARILQRDPSVDLIATDPDGSGPDRGRGAADELGVAYVDSYDDAFAWGPDAVVVTTENSGHLALVERAVQAGIHVLCEKPLATRLEDGTRMVAAAADAGVRFMTAYPVRFAAAFAELRRRVADGELGRVLAVHGANNGKMPGGDSWFTDPELAGGGSLVDHVVHCADLFDALLGVEPTTVRAVANDILHPEIDGRVETGGIVTLQYPGGVIGTIDCSWSWPDASPTWGGLQLEVIGTRGSVRVDPFAQHLGGFEATGPLWIGTGDDLDEAMIAEFLDAVASGRTPQPDGGAGLRTLRIVDAAQRSARAGGAPVAPA